jgi:hypothetical protein
LKRSFYILFFIAITGLNSCKKDPGATLDLGYNYFPEQAGKYVVYNVDSIFYNGNYSPARKDTFKFQIKEKIQSIYIDNEGRSTMRLERYVKYYDRNIPYSGMDWILRDVWAQNRTARSAEKVEENVRFKKLVFPLTEDVTWNGNVYNTDGEETYKYEFVDRPRTVGILAFDSVLQVDQHNETNLIIQKYKEEKYARNVGMVYKRIVDLDSQYPSSWNSNPYLNDSLALFYPKPIVERASSGYQYTMTITSYGTE